MNKKNKYLVVLITIYILSFLLIFNPFQFQGISTDTKINNHLELIYKSDAPISIQNNSALAGASSSGNGTLSNPFIIKDLYINASGTNFHGIEIKNTNLYFILKNCTVFKSDLNKSSILLNNVTKGTLLNNTVKNSGNHGIRLDNSSYNNLTFNTISLNPTSGIYFDNSNNNNITFNIFYKNSKNILEIGGSLNNNIEKNAFPIIINNNFEFNHYKNQGNGSFSNPYIIENYIIDIFGLETHGISICDTTDYFILRNCIIDNISAPYVGIRFENITNSQIFNLTLSNVIGKSDNPGDNAIGMTLIGCRNLNISSINISFISGNRGSSAVNGADGEDGGSSYGIFIRNSNNIIIQKNYISNISGGSGGNGSDAVDFLDNGGKSGSGGSCFGIYINYSSFISIFENRIWNLNGGYSGKSGDGSDAFNTLKAGNGGVGRNGGNSYGILFDYSVNLSVDLNNISNIKSGKGGNGGNGGNADLYGSIEGRFGGDGGRGGESGLSLGISSLNSINISLNNNYIFKISTNIGGNGGDGGISYNFAYGFGGKGGNCGLSTGIHLKNLTITINKRNIIENISKNFGGLGGYNPNYGTYAPEGDIGNAMGLLLHNTNNIFSHLNSIFLVEGNGTNIINSYDNIFTKNYIFSNSKSGIVLSKICENNTLIDNQIINNSKSGIEFIDNCKNNSIIDNLIFNNSIHGIKLGFNCINNTIFNNTIINNSNSGILITSNLENITIINNLISYNYNYGIDCKSNCDFNLIHYNQIINNSKSGIKFDNICNENNVTRNFFTLNNDYGIIVYGDSNYFFQNYAWGNIDGDLRDLGIQNIWIDNLINKDGDRDNDGLTNNEEVILGTDLFLNDTDIDLIHDGWEIDNFLDPLNASDALLDMDSDGLINLGEYLNGTGINNSDSDTDGLNDSMEVFISLTNPNSFDTDYDTIPDGWEFYNGTDPKVFDGYLDYDNDSLINYFEYKYRTNPLNNDTDGDGYSDGDEIIIGTDPLDITDFPAQTNNPQNYLLPLTILISAIIIASVITFYIILRKNKPVSNPNTQKKVSKLKNIK